MGMCECEFEGLCLRLEVMEMKGYAIVNGKKVSFVLSRGLAEAHRRNAGNVLSAVEAIQVVEERRRVRALKHAGRP